jgi:hypothetical protein
MRLESWVPIWGMMEIGLGTLKCHGFSRHQGLWKGSENGAVDTATVERFSTCAIAGPHALMVSCTRISKL